MADIAELGFEIDSQPAERAAENLDKLAESAGKAERGTTTILASIERVVREIQNLVNV